MIYPKTNYTEAIIRTFDLHSPESLFKTCNFSKTKINFITNPVLSSLIKTYIHPSKLPHKNLLIESKTDMAYCKLAGHAITRISEELRSNSNFFYETKRRLLSHHRGSFFSSFNEIFVASYLKELDYQISFNSSSETSKPDIEARDKDTLSLDVKTFPDNEFWFEAQIHSLFPQLMKFIHQLPNIKLLAFVTENDIQFKKDFQYAMLNFLNTKRDQNLKSCSIMQMPQVQYIGSQGVELKDLISNSSIRIIPSIPLSDEIILSIIEKAISQQSKAAGDGLTWILFPNDKDFSMGRRLVWEVSSIPQKLKGTSNNLVLYDFYIKPNANPTKLDIRFGADFLINTDKHPKISKQSYNDYFYKLINTPTFFIP